MVLRGRGVSPGVACAPLVRLGAPVVTSAGDAVGADPEHERGRVGGALTAVAADLGARADRADGDVADILATTAAMALDPSLLAAAEENVARGVPTGHAVTLAIEGCCTRLDALGGYLAERVTDLRDVGRRAVAHLAGVPMPGVPAPGYPVVLDPWRPLDLVALVGEAGRLRGRPVGVCGEAAADPLLAAVLVGLGVGSLSTAPASRAAVRARPARHTLADCARLADVARASRRAADARTAVERAAA